jgi:translation initiation factor IF-3
VVADIQEAGNIEQMPKQEGRALSMVIAPKSS